MFIFIFYFFFLKTSSEVILEVNGEEFFTPVFVVFFLYFFIGRFLFFVVVIAINFIFFIEICECECSTIYKGVHSRVKGRRAQGRVNRMQCLFNHQILID